MLTARSLFVPVALAVLGAGCAPQSGPAPEAPATHAVARLAEACVNIGVKGCTTTEGGYFNVAGRVLYWQIQSGETSSDLSGAAYVFIIKDGAGDLRSVASGADGYFYEAPSLVRVDQTAHLAIAGRMRGTGNFNADALYRLTPDGASPLVKLDNESWRDTLTRHLPPGLGVRKGVSFTYGDETITALTSLWRDADGECCPTGGEARLFFAIEDDRLVLRSAERLAS
ncbi:hypothetical protein [Brevundimonas sp.]|uniref:hypothetical protein n=1 Tax=Brevundimonas sp. TaxID=1871086 RepID=UPI0027313FBF|nr:hypothetical protein [Brevundimonas sp.]MDP1912422.1 hypothetical protein [Brevundimonas sp.]